MNLNIEYMKKLFSLNSGISDKKTFSVKDYNDTYEYPKKVMRVSGLRLMAKDSPLVRRIWDAYYWVQFVNLLLSLILNVGKLGEIFAEWSFDDITKIFRMLPCMGYLILAILKSHKMVLQRPVYENLISELRDMWPEGRVPDEDQIILNKALKELNIIVKGYYYCNYLLGISFLAPSYLEIIQRAAGEDIPRILPYNYWMPYDENKPGLFEFTLTLQAWHTMITLWFMLCGDLLFCIFLSHITTQFELLSTRIVRLLAVPVDHQLIPEYPLAANHKALMSTHRASERTDDLNAKELQYDEEMRKIVIRHKALIRLSRDVENLFSFSLLFNFFYSSIIICFCAFCCVRVEKWNEFMYKLFLTTALSQMWLLCWHGQKLIDSSYGISRALYNGGWYSASKKIKISTLVMMRRSQKDVHVTTYGFSIISLSSFTTIIKSAWSYFTLLLNTFQPSQ